MMVLNISNFNKTKQIANFKHQLSKKVLDFFIKTNTEFPEHYICLLKL